MSVKTDTVIVPAYAAVYRVCITENYEKAAPPLTASRKRRLHRLAGLNLLEKAYALVPFVRPSIVTEFQYGAYAD